MTFWGFGPEHPTCGRSGADARGAGPPTGAWRQVVLVEVVVDVSLEDRGGVDSAEGRIAIGWLIVEDVVTTVELCRRHGIWGKGSEDKFVPDAIFGLNRVHYDAVVNSIHDPWESDNFSSVLTAFEHIVNTITEPT